MTQYVILIYGDETAVRDADAPRRGADDATRTARSRRPSPTWAARSSAATALQPTDDARRPSAGGVVTDGPFVETKEALGGYYLVEARDLDQALAIAKLCPAPFGGVEVRPVMDIDRPGRDADGPRAVAGALARRAPSRVGLRARRDGARRRATSTSPRSARRRRTSTRCTAWARHGVPARPGAWLTTAARRRALDRSAARSRCARKLPLLVEPDEAGASAAPTGPERRRGVPDDRLRLVFTCCHPALDPAARVALTLRLVCGRRHGRTSPGRSSCPSRRWPRGSPGPRRRSPRRGSPTGSPPAAELPGAARQRARRRPPALHAPGTRRRPATSWSARTSASGRVDLARTLARCCRTSRRSRGLLGAAAAHRRPPRDPGRRRRPAAAARGAGPRPVGPRADRRGPALRPSRRCAAGRRAGSRCRPRSPARTPSRRVRRDRLGRRSCALYDLLLRSWALSGRRAQPGGRGRRSRAGPEAGARRARRGWPRDGRARRRTRTCRAARARPAAPARPGRRGGAPRTRRRWR